MNHEAADRLQVESEEAYVVYDAKTGRIVHVHRAFTHRGAKRLPRGAKGEARALEMAASFGHRTKGLRALAVSPDELNLIGPKRVDVKSRKLVVEPDA